METRWAELIAVAVRGICTATVNMAKYVNKKNETPWTMWEQSITHSEMKAAHFVNTCSLR